MAKKKRKRLVDCTFRCPEDPRVDFNVFPRKSQSPKEACVSKLKSFHKRASDCELLRSRLINGVSLADLPPGDPLLELMQGSKAECNGDKKCERGVEIVTQRVSDFLSPVHAPPPSKPMKVRIVRE